MTSISPLNSVHLAGDHGNFKNNLSNLEGLDLPKIEGYLIIIENEEGYYCILSGMKKIIISSGNEVFMGEPIAKISAENNSQLYFELRLNGKIINPKSKVEIL